jgi:uncharacterized phage protein (TIGR02220 family)
MADQKKWFKVWTTLLIDSLSSKIEDIGRFTILGCLIASRGENGKLVTDKRTLQTLLQCNEIPNDFMRNFNVIIEEIQGNSNGSLSVTLKNWNKYQLDSTGYERQQRYREVHSVTAKVTAKVTEQDKIRIDKRREDNIRIDKNIKDNNILFLEIISDLNEKASKNYKLTKITKELIYARIKEDFTLDDFKTVHLNMSTKWKHDPKMNQYLRPSTLYCASKFEGYLNVNINLMGGKNHATGHPSNKSSITGEKETNSTESNKYNGFGTVIDLDE